MPWVSYPFLKLSKSDISENVERDLISYAALAGACGFHASTWASFQMPGVKAKPRACDEIFVPSEMIRPAAARSE